MVKRLLIIVSLFFVLLFPNVSFGSEQFGENYVVSYSVSETGETEVSEQVSIRNLTDQYFGKNYTTIIPATQVFDVSAADGSRNLKVDVGLEGQKTKITVNFPEQIIGKDKEYGWTLRYKTRDFAQKHGEVWQFSVPKLAEIKNLEKYDVSLSIPTIFGDPVKAVPNPFSDRESGNTLEYFFRKDQLLDGGISMYFGKQQVFDFRLAYELENKNLLPSVQSIIIPTQGPFQDIVISSIEPKPENVVFDADHNAVGFFKLSGRGKLAVTIAGQAKLDLDRQLTELPEADTLQQYLRDTSIWDISSPQVQEALQIALDGQTNLTTQDKIKRIYDYVGSAIRFGDYATTNEFSNNSASSILQNPEGRFCQDFVNVFIALSRAAQIPAEQVVGLAYTQNTTLRPVCYSNKNLHTWVRVYDVQKGWVTVDPTWGATTGGGDYFSYSDLSHIQIGSVGAESKSFAFPKAVQFQFSSGEFLPNYQIVPKIIGSAEVIAGFPYTLTFRLENGSNTTLPAGSMRIEQGRLQFKPVDRSTLAQEYYYPQIPPFGYVDFDFRVKSMLAWDSYTDEVSLFVQDQRVKKNIEVQPLFYHRSFSLAIFGITFGMMGLYILALVLHYKSPLSLIKEEVTLIEKAVTKEKKKKSQKKRKKV